MSYEQEEFEKVKLVVKAALKNKTVSGGSKITITSDGHNPKASVTVEAYVLEKMLKESLT